MIETIDARDVLIIGTTPLVSQRVGVIGRDPLSKFRDSLFCIEGDAGPTRLYWPAPHFKGAMMGGASGAAEKRDVRRHVLVRPDKIRLYGIPLLSIRLRPTFRSERVNMEARAVIPHWCCKLTIWFGGPMRDAKDIIASAGDVGIGGDLREGHGRFRIVGPDDVSDFARIVESAGLAVQDRAITNPELHGEITQELYAWLKEAA